MVKIEFSVLILNLFEYVLNLNRFYVHYNTYETNFYIFLDSNLYAHFVFKAFDVKSNGAISFKVSYSKKCIVPSLRYYNYIILMNVIFACIISPRLEYYY